MMMEHDMKIIFVDAENIGLKEVEKVNASVIDKVFVFSKNESIKRMCEKSLFLCLSDYPSGANQADFYIIAYLSRVLVALSKKQLGSIVFQLYSNDENLISAFKFQCSLLGGTTETHRTKDDTVVPIQPTSFTDLLLNNLGSPQHLNPSMQAKLGMSKAEFTRAVNELNKSNKIKRSSEDKNKWMRC